MFFHPYIVANNMLSRLRSDAFPRTRAASLKSAAVTFVLSTHKHTVRKCCSIMFHSDRRSTVLGGKKVAWQRFIPSALQLIFAVRRSDDLGSNGSPPLAMLGVQGNSSCMKRALRKTRAGACIRFCHRGSALRRRQVAQQSK